MLSVCQRLIVIVVLLTLMGCARTYQARSVEIAGFQDDYSLLKEGGDDDALLSYWRKGVNWRGYKKIILEPVVIKKTKESGLYDMTHAENYQLSELLGYRLQEALKKRFKLVNKPAPDTLRIAYAITDVATSIVLLDMFSSVYPSARATSGLHHLVFGSEAFVGEASVEGKITDSTTGELLMAQADARAGGKTLIGSTNEWDDVEECYKFWALQLSYQLCMRQAQPHCQKPDPESDGWFKF
ncbi:hypothetical protein MCAMS1_02045 [biofilm metagenome]